MAAFRLLIVQFLILLPLAIVMWIAVAEALFWRLWWLDIPMHFFGGMWAGVCGAWLLARRRKPFTLLWCLGFALLVGVAWEVFEYSEGIAASHYFDYPIDTMKDLAMDLIGAVAGWFLATALMSEPDAR